MKKIIVGILSFAFLFIGGQSVFAATNSVAWNTASNDCPTISIINVNSDDGYTNPCWGNDPISANPGDYINVRIYYHNTGNSTATNTHIKLNAPSGSSTSHSFSAQITSDQGNKSSSAVRVNIPSSQTLTFSRVEWTTENTNERITNLLNGQNGSEVLSGSGLYIGDIAPGWPSQGSVVVSFKVSNTAAATCTINNFSANPNTINKGEGSTLSWNTRNCTNLNIQTSVGPVSGAIGSKTVYPTQTTTYTLVATGADYTEKRMSTTVTVNSVTASCAISSFTASDYSITAGQSTTLSWGLTDGCISTNLRASTDYGTNVTGYNSKTYSPTVTTTYTLVATASDWVTQTSKTLTVTVDQPSVCKINSFTANPTSITRGQYSILNWSTSGCSNVTISNLGYSVPTSSVSGGQQIWPTTTTTYVMTASGATGNVTKSVTVQVDAPSVCNISSFTASPSSITKGQYSTLTWRTVNCKNVSISGVGSVLTSDSKDVNPTVTTTYTLTAYGQSIGDDVQHTKSVTVYVNQPAECSIVSYTVNGQASISSTPNQPATLSWVTNGCTTASISSANVDTTGSKTVYPATTTTYTLNVHGLTGATKTASVTVYVNQPNLCSISRFASNPTSIDRGQSSILSWDTTNCTSASISSIGIVTPVSGGSRSVSPSQTTTYTLTATGANGQTQTSTTTVYVNEVISNCSISRFTATPASITSGQSSILSWATSNCADVTISNLSYNVPTTGSQEVWPTQTTTYVLTATGSNGEIQTRTATVYVGQPAVCAISTFIANPTSVTSGQASTLSWNTSNCVSASISSIGSVTPVSAGSRTVYPTTTTTYTLTAIGATGAAQTSTATVYVNQPSVCAISYFTANPTSITSGQTSVLSWATTDCVNVTISNLGYNTPTSSVPGGQPIWPTQTTTYVLTAYGITGTSQTSTATVYVNQPSLCSIDGFTTSDNSITSSGSATLSWNTTNCTSASISPIGSVSVDGSRVVSPSYTTTYTLTAYGTNGQTETRALTIYVNEGTLECSISSFTASDDDIEEGDYTTLHWNTNGCERVKISDLGNVSDDGSERVYPFEDTTYVLTAYDSDWHSITRQVRINVDGDNNDDNNCSIDTFTSTDTYIERGDRVTLRWNTSDCNYVNITDLGNVSLDGSRNVYPAYTTTYTLKARGYNGRVRERSVQINVGRDIIPIYNTNVVTTVATNVSQTGAQLNGLITSSNYTNSNVYFEYGTTINLGSRTASRSTNSNTNFSEYVTNLSPNTIYYFQALSVGQDGLSRGAIEVFRTLGYNINTNTNTNTNTVIRYVNQGTTVYGSQSPLILRIENRYQNVGVGDIIDYTVYYKNISSSTLYRPMVQVYIPEGITLMNTSHGTYSEDDRTVSVPIEDLVSNAEGVIYLQGRVDSLDSSLAQIVTTAILVYTNPNGAQENAMAYVLNNPSTNSNLLGASAFFGNLFGFGLIGWLLLIILILLLVLVARSLYSRRNVTTTTTHRIIS